MPSLVGAVQQKLMEYHTFAAPIVVTPVTDAAAAAAPASAPSDVFDSRNVTLAKLCRRYGAAIVLVAFVEQGQGATIDDKLCMRQRCYKL